MRELLFGRNMYGYSTSGQTHSLELLHLFLPKKHSWIILYKSYVSDPRSIASIILIVLSQPIATAWGPVEREHTED